MRHLKLIADDHRREEAAELEAALYHSDATEDELSSLSNDNLSNAPKYKDNFLKNGPATTSQSKFSHLSTSKTTSFFRALPTLNSTCYMTLADFLRPKAQTSVRFATQPFQASWQEDVARHSSHHNPVVSATIDAAPPTQFSKENQADFYTSQTDMTDHNFTYDQTQQARANHLNIPDWRNSVLSCRQQPSDYGDLLRGNSDHLIPKPNVKRFEGEPLEYL